MLGVLLFIQFHYKLLLDTYRNVLMMGVVSMSTT